MAESLEEIKPCSNCKRNIASQNFIMHTLHCQRNLLLCHLCNECFPRTALKTHIDEDHALMCCMECGCNIEKLNLKEHKELHCKHRLIQCKFCGIENPFAEMKEHENYCGSRTERCDFCRQFVLIKDIVEHCSKIHNKTTKLDYHPLANSYVSSDANAVEREKVTRKDSFTNSLASSGSVASSRVNVLSMNKRTNDMPQLNTSVPDKNTKPVQKVPLVADVLASEEILNIHDDCLSDEIIAQHIAEEGARQNSLVYNNPRAPSPVPSLESAVPQFVGVQNLISASDHVSQILNNISDSESEALSNEGNGNFLSDVRHNSLKESQFSPDLYLSNSDSNVCLSLFNVEEQEAILTSVKSKLNVDIPNEPEECVPCEFCNESIPLQMLMKHEVECQRSAQFDVFHQNLAPVRVNQPNPQGWNSTVNSNGDKNDIPCEFCEALFPFSVIRTHQASCDQTPLVANRTDSIQYSTNAESLQSIVEQQQLLKGIDYDENAFNNVMLNSLVYEDSNEPPTNKTTKNLVEQELDKNRLAGSFPEQTRNSARSNGRNFRQMSNPPIPIQSSPYSPSPLNTSFRNGSSVDVHRSASFKENNIQTDVNESGLSFLEFGSRPQLTLQSQQSLTRPEMNNYLKESFMHGHANSVEYFQTKEGCSKKSIIRDGANKLALQVRNTYHKEEVRKVDKRSVNDENFRHYKNQHANSTKNGNASRHGTAPPHSLYFREMKAALHPVSNSQEQDGYHSNAAAIGGGRPSVQNISNESSQRNNDRYVQGISKSPKPKNLSDNKFVANYHNRTAENFTNRLDGCSNRPDSPSSPNSTNRRTGAVPKVISQRNVGWIKK